MCFALATVIGAGLATRVVSLPWPEFVSNNFGDALWTVAVYLCICFLSPKANKIAIVTLAAFISIAIEFSQLLTFPWLVSIRETLPGRLLLGTGFLWIDIPRYLSGALAAFFIEWFWEPLKQKRDT